MKNLEKTLETLGFEEKEAALYISALNLGTAPMTLIAKHAGLKEARPTRFLRYWRKRALWEVSKCLAVAFYGGQSGGSLFTAQERTCQLCGGVAGTYGV